MKNRSILNKTYIAFLALYLMLGHIPLSGLSICFENDGSLKIKIRSDLIESQNENKNCEENEDLTKCNGIGHCGECTDIPIPSNTLDNVITNHKSSVSKGFTYNLFIYNQSEPQSISEYVVEESNSSDCFSIISLNIICSQILLI